MAYAKTTINLKVQPDYTVCKYEHTSMQQVSDVYIVVLLMGNLFCSSAPLPALRSPVLFMSVISLSCTMLPALHLSKNLFVFKTFL
jgi:hypothetical protein